MNSLSVTFDIAQPPDRVFAALTDPAILQRCIPGCEELKPIGGDVYEARLRIGVAGLKGTYSGRAELRDKRPPESFALVFDGKGTPGFVRGTAAIRIVPVDSGARVTSDAQVQVGGLIAAVGSRLVDAAARKLAAEFFQQLAIEMGAARATANN
jgi:carbon monoxide dehydrogenase subunit G